MDIKKLDYSIGNVTSKNDALITGAVDDVASLVKNTLHDTANTVAPTLDVLLQNTSQFVRNPAQSFKDGAFEKFLMTFPTAFADIAAKAVRLPFKTLENAMTYVVANNMQRGVDTVKGVTTDAARNWFLNGGNSNKFMKGLGHLIGWSGDIVGSITKAVPGGAEWLTQQPNKWVLDPATSKTQSWVEKQRLSETNLWDANIFQNSGSGHVHA